MAKTKNIIAAVVGVAGLYFIYQYFKKGTVSNTFTPSQSGGNVPSGSTPTASKATDSFPLKKGSKGDNVRMLQQLLLKIDKTLLPKFGADGDFGSETEAAVQKVLNKKTVDGQNDLNKLNLIFNQKSFPLVVPIVKSDEPPKFDPFAFLK
jgi:hypothetical protein